MTTIDIHKHGFVRLVDTMPTEDLDAAIVQAARVSYSEGTKTVRSDEGLVRYLLRHKHTTPFEMVEFKFHIKMPIFIARQHMRHRTSSINELSARYSVMPDEYYVPDMYRTQSVTNKQSSEAEFEIGDAMRNQVKYSCDNAFAVYGQMIEAGCSRELARCHLPVSTYTEFYWKINLHNLLHYLRLRMEIGAQEEIRAYAIAMYDLIKDKVPITIKAFNDFQVNSMNLTGPDIEALKKYFNITPKDDAPEKYLTSPGENREFIAKLKILTE